MARVRDPNLISGYRLSKHDSQSRMHSPASATLKTDGAPQ
jgi:hypothetical protein